MIDISATVIGAEGVIARFDDVASAMRNRLRLKLDSLGHQIAAIAQGNAPSKTGTMRAGIRPIFTETLTQLKESIIAPWPALALEYGVVNHGGAHNKNAGRGKRGKKARLHELRSQGQWRIEPRPFMAPAIASMRQRIDDELAGALEEVAQENQ